MGGEDLGKVSEGEGIEVRNRELRRTKRRLRRRKGRRNLYIYLRIIEIGVSCKKVRKGIREHGGSVLIPRRVESIREAGSWLALDGW